MVIFQDILSHFQHSEALLRKLALVQTTFAQPQLVIHYLSILASLNKYDNIHFQACTLEIHIFHQLFTKIYDGKFNAEWKVSFRLVNLIQKQKYFFKYPPILYNPV